MKTELIEVSPTRKEIKIEIEPDAIKETYNRISDEYAKHAKIPGFRPGHAPVSVVRTRFKNEIRSDVLRELVPEAINDAITKHELSTIGEPQVHLDNTEGLDQLGTQSLSVKVDVEVLPEIELKKYKNLAASRRVRPVTDADVERVIEGLREASGSLQPVEDRPAQLGDTVTVTFHGKFVDEPDAEDINVEDVDVTLGGEGVQAEFTDNLLGTQTDDERTFRVVYPENFSSKGLAGKTVDYEAKVSAVRIKEIPDLDDEWAKTLGEDLESLATLQQKIREDLEKRALSEADNRLRNELMRKLREEHQFEVPESLVEHQTNFRFESVVRDMIGHGIDPRGQDLNWEGARAELKTQAEHDVRGSLLLEAIAAAEDISVSNEEIEDEIAAIAQASKQSKEQVRAILTKEGGERSIAHRLQNRKVLDLLIENADITDEEWREEESDEDRELTDEVQANAE